MLQPCLDESPTDVLASYPRAHDANVVLLTNFVPPHQVPVYSKLAESVGKLTILVSTPMEANRPWSPDWGDLDVRVQKTWTLQGKWSHKVGFSDKIYVHIPRDTVTQLDKIAPDVIVSSEMGARSLLCARYKRRHPETALVLSTALSEHTEKGRGWLRRRLRKWLIRQADCVTVNGASGERYLAGLGCPREKVFLEMYTPKPDCIYTGPATRPAGESHRLLYVGQLIERKGLLRFVEVLSRWAKQNPDERVELLLAGSGPQRETIEAIERPANLKIELLGECKPERVRELFESCGILVLPTLADEWALVVNEAMASGLPVLGSRYAQAVDELCEMGVTGWPYTPDAPGDLEQALDAAFGTSPEQLDAMRSAARERVEGRTPEFAAECFAAAIDAALEIRDDA